MPTFDRATEPTAGVLSTATRRGRAPSANAAWSWLRRRPRSSNSTPPNNAKAGDRVASEVPLVVGESFKRRHPRREFRDYESGADDRQRIAGPRPRRSASRPSGHTAERALASSALIRHSIASPCQRMSSSREGERLARGGQDFLAHGVHARDPPGPPGVAGGH